MVDLNDSVLNIMIPPVNSYNDSYSSNRIIKANLKRQNRQLVELLAFFETTYV